MWAGGVVLSEVLTTDRRRAVLLVEPDPAVREEATRRGRPGVTVSGADGLAALERVESAVLIDLGEGDPPPLTDLLDGPLRDAAIAVVVRPARADDTLAALAARPRPATAHPLHVRLASVIGPDDDGATAAAQLGGSQADPLAVVVLSGAEGQPSTLVGRDAGSARWWSDEARVRHAIREADQLVQDEDALRLRDLPLQLADAEQRLHDREVHIDGLQRRIDDLEASTSWRVTRPLRWGADRARRR